MYLCIHTQQCDQHGVSYINSPQYEHQIHKQKIKKNKIPMCPDGQINKQRSTCERPTNFAVRIYAHTVQVQVYASRLIRYTLGTRQVHVRYTLDKCNVCIQAHTVFIHTQGVVCERSIIHAVRIHAHPVRLRCMTLGVRGSDCPRVFQTQRTHSL